MLSSTHIRTFPLSEVAGRERKDRRIRAVIKRRLGKLDQRIETVHKTASFIAFSRTLLLPNTTNPARSITYQQQHLTLLPLKQPLQTNVQTQLDEYLTYSLIDFGFLFSSESLAGTTSIGSMQFKLQHHLPQLRNTMCGNNIEINECGHDQKESERKKEKTVVKEVELAEGSLNS